MKQKKDPPATRIVPLETVVKRVGHPVAQYNTDFGKRLRDAREQAKLTQLQLSELLGITRNAVTCWERGVARPDFEKLSNICAILQISADYLLGFTAQSIAPSKEASTLLQRYYSLSTRDRKIIDNMMDVMHENDYLKLKEHFDELFVYRAHNPLKACAGDGIELLDGKQPLQTLVRLNDLTERCDEIIRITGDSMLPTYAQGDRVLLEHMPSINIGQIGIFVVNGEGMIKEFQGDHLHPLNPEYKDIYLDASMDVRCVGLVLGKLTPDMLPTRDEQYMIDDVLEERRNEARQKRFRKDAEEE